MHQFILISNERLGILDLSPLLDAHGQRLVLQSKGHAKSTKECDRSALDHPHIQKLLDAKPPWVSWRETLVEEPDAREGEDEGKDENESEDGEPSPATVTPPNNEPPALPLAAEQPPVTPPTTNDEPSASPPAPLAAEQPHVAPANIEPPVPLEGIPSAPDADAVPITTSSVEQPTVDSVVSSETVDIASSLSVDVKHEGALDSRSSKKSRR